MRKSFRLVASLLLSVVALLALASAAGAGTITQPSTNPFNVPGQQGAPQQFTISGTGWTPNTQVFIEICDGVSPTTPGWDPAIHCDNGTSPSGAVAKPDGSVTFPANDPNLGLQPFDGVSPSGTFDCLYNGEANPGDGNPAYTNCQLRMSSNNASATSDQTFVTLTLPATGSGGQAPEVQYVILLPLAALLVAGGFFFYRRRSHAAA